MAMMVKRSCQEPGDEDRAAARRRRGRKMKAAAAASRVSDAAPVPRA